MPDFGDQPTRESAIASLAESAAYGNLGLFIGSGFSKAVLHKGHDSIAPSWPELLEQAAGRMKVDYAAIEKSGRSYPEIASSICASDSQSKKRDFSKSVRHLKREIADLTCLYPSQSQREEYSKYIDALSPDWIITTNYDLVIESLLTGKSIPLGPNDSLSSPTGTVPVFHLHGIRTNPEEIIITQEDYVTLFRPSEYRQMKLALTIRESTTLFLGYGLGDVNVLTALDWSKHVFRSEKQDYPNDVVQVYKQNNPAEQPYRDRNGILIIETADLPSFFEEFIEGQVELAKQKEKEKKVLEVLANKLNSPDAPLIEEFIDNLKFRKQILKILSRFPIHLVAGFVSFLDKCIDETWERSRPRGAFEAYNQNLTIVLDILITFSLDRFPPALLQAAAYALERVAYYVGDSLGQSRSAGRTWNQRRGELTAEIIGELRAISERYGYVQLESLLDQTVGARQ